MQGALDALRDSPLKMLGVRGIGLRHNTVIGVVSREAIETYYRRWPSAPATHPTPH